MLDIAARYPNLSPPLQLMRLSAHLSRRSEIMTSGWRGGGRVVGKSFHTRPKAGRHDPVRRGRRYKRAGRLHAEPFQKTMPSRMRRPQKPGSAGPQVRPLQRTARSSRCGTGCARAGLPYAQNPDRPARREPRFVCGLPAWGECLAGPASLQATPMAEASRTLQPAANSAGVVFWPSLMVPALAASASMVTGSANPANFSISRCPSAEERCVVGKTRRASG